MNALVVHSPRYACDIGPHVFPTIKYDRVRNRLVSEGWVRPESIYDPPPAGRELLQLVHTSQYLDDLEALRMTPRTAYSELPLSEPIIDSFRSAATGTYIAAKTALTHRAAVHVGGGLHHASADHAEGFCYINDLAVAIRALQQEGAVRRVAVVDLDVHQGNGTAMIFENDPTVFTLSLHQENNYPIPKATSTLDVGLDDGTGDDDYDRALAAALEPVWAFAPELVLYAAGADPYVDDQLGGLALTFDGLERRDRRVMEGCVARRIPVAVTLAGGYARQLEDTVAIQTVTCRIALTIAGMKPAGAIA